MRARPLPGEDRLSKHPKDGVTRKLLGQRTATDSWVPIVALLMLATLVSCRGNPAKPYQVAEPWSLKGPFRHLLGEPRAAPSTSPSTPAVQTTAEEEHPHEQGEPRAEVSAEPGAELNPEPPASSFSLRETTDATSPQPVSDDLLTPAAERAGLFSHGKDSDEDYWYLDMGFRLGQVALGSTSSQLDHRLDPLLALDWAHVFDRPYTPRDRKTDWGMTTQYLGIGRRETDWFTWNFYLGYGFGGDPNHDRVANLNIDVDFQYNFIYTGLTTDLYPWGKPRHGNYPDWKERLYASRPYILSGFELGYLRARGRGYIKFAPIGKLYQDSQAVEDWLFSYLIGLGWEVPIDERWSFTTSAHYTFHFYRPEEYNGYNITIAFRYRF